MGHFDPPSRLWHALMNVGVPTCGQCGRLWYAGDGAPRRAPPFFCGRWCAWRGVGTGLAVVLRMLAGEVRGAFHPPAGFPIRRVLALLFEVARGHFPSPADFPGAIPIGWCTVRIGGPPSFLVNYSAPFTLDIPLHERPEVVGALQRVFSKSAAPASPEGLRGLSLS